MKFVDLTGRKFGRLSVVERVENTVSPGGVQQVRQRCKCDCGNETVVHAGNLRNGNTSSCGCLNIESLHRNKPIDITGQTFGRLTAIRRVEDYVSPHGNKSTRWECRCECGNIKIAHLNSLKKGATKSCGCIGASYGEFTIESILRSRNIRYIKEYSFDGLVSSKGKLLRFDFAIRDWEDRIVALIEFQGIQHYKDYAFNGKSFGELQRNETDKLKKDFCIKNNIPLFEIRYNDDISIKTHEIINALYDNLVPSPALPERCNDYP